MKRKTAYLGLFTAVAIIFGYVETLLPVVVGIPGVKIGLANLVTVFVLYIYTWKEALIVSVMRILVTGFLFGNLFSILFSLTGGLLSLLIMAFLKRKEFSIIGVSIAGGVAHNIGQIIIAALVVENVKMYYYMPVLLVSGLITGGCIGVVSQELLRRLTPILGITD